MAIPTCPRDFQGQLTCTQHANTGCMSLHYGLHQDCKMADGWLTCLDINVTPQKQSDCNQNYGVHNNSVWVRDGCEANFEACYVSDVFGLKLRQRTLECRNLDYTFKQCRVDGAKLIKDVELKQELPSRVPCSKGINYGIFNNSMWIHSGCNGIFDIQYYEDSSSSVAPPPTPAPKTTRLPTTTPSTQKTPYVKYPFDPETPRPPNPVTHTSTSSTSPTGATPFQGRDNLVPITVAVFMGIFVALLLVLFAVLWICRRNTVVKRHLGDPGTTEKSTRESDELSNAYEEIAPVLELSRYNKPREDDPFLPSKCNNLNMEHNNNPPLPHPPNNYFILEPHTPDPPTPRGSTISSSSHSYYKVDPVIPPFIAPPPLPGIPPPLPDPNVQPYAQTMLNMEQMPNPFVRNIPTAPPTMEDNSMQLSPQEINFVDYNTNPSTFAPIPQYNSLARDGSQNSRKGEDGYEKIRNQWADPRVRDSFTPEGHVHSSTPDRLTQSTSSTPDRFGHSSTPDRLLLADSDSHHRHKDRSPTGHFNSFDNHSQC